MAFDLLATPSEHNIAWSWIMTMFPDDTSSAWGFAMAVFTSALTYVFALFICWGVVAGIIHSAYSGKVLGEKYHQIWMPLRVVLGLGLLVPIAGNFSSSHYLLRDVVARAAINLADGAWVAYVDYAAGKVPKIAPLSPGGTKLVLDILESEICAAVSNAKAKPWGLPMVRLPAAMGERTSDSSWFSSVTSNERTVWAYGPDCGSITLPVLSDHMGFTTDRETAVGKIVMQIRNAAKPYADYFAVHDTALSVEAAKQAIYDGKLPAIAMQLRALGHQYDADISAATQKEMALDTDAATRRQRLVDAARQQGFVTAGMWWMNISQQSQQVAEFTGAKHERVALRLAESGASNQEHLDAAIKTLRHAISGEEAEIGVSANDLGRVGDQESNILTRLTAPVWRSVGEWVLSKHREPGDSTVETILKSDPVGDAISSGHFFMGVAETGIYGGLIAITLAFTTAGDIIGADGAATWAMAWAFPMLGTLWVVGAVRAYILPVLPFIYVWMFAAMWLLAVLEAGIAMVVWAFGFARMNGDELLAEQSKMGTMLTFQVLLMPILGLLAYEACFILLPLIIGGIEVFWSTAFYGQTGGRVPSASSMGVGFVLITFLNVYLTMHLLGQIFHIPNHIMTWFGASGRDFGDKSLFAATAGAAAATLGRGMPGLPGLPKPKGGDDDNGGGKGGASGMGKRNLSPMAAKAAEPKVLD